MLLCSQGRPRAESNPEGRPGTAVRFRLGVVQPGTAACGANPSRAAWDGRANLDAWPGTATYGLGRPCVFRVEVVQPGTAACCAVPSCAARDGRVLSPMQMHGRERPCAAESRLCSQGRPQDVRLSYAAGDGRVLCESGSRIPNVHPRHGSFAAWDGRMQSSSELRSLGRPRVQSNPNARPGTAVRCGINIV